jgi:hypothetical protein
MDNRVLSDTYRRALYQMAQQKGYALTFAFKEMGPDHRRLYEWTFYLGELGSPPLTGTPVTGEWRYSRDAAKEEAAHRALPVLHSFPNRRRTYL